MISGRELLNGPIVGLKDRGTHQQLAGFCESLGLPAPNDVGSKRERMEASFRLERGSQTAPDGPRPRSKLDDSRWPSQMSLTSIAARAPGYNRSYT